MSQEKPEIHYPCEWRIKLIGENRDSMGSAIGRVLGQKEFSLSGSNRSKTGRFVSVNIDLMLLSDKERLELYRDLQLQPEFKFVI